MSGRINVGVGLFLRLTTLALEHRHIPSSSLFKHADRRMILDGIRGAATMNNR
jgi:hypothetical protein